MTAPPLRLLTLCGLLTALAVGRPLGAQQGVVLELGLTGAHFVDDDASVFGPSLRLSAAGTRGRLFASGEAGTVATFGAASAFALVQGGVRAPIAGAWFAELAGEGSSVAGSKNQGAAGTGVVSGRLLAVREGSGAWLRASAHASGRENGALGGGGADAGAWWDLPRTRLTATLTQEWTRAELYTGRFRTGYVGTAAVRYTEGGVSLHTEGDRGTLDAAVSLRRDPDADQTMDHGASVSGAWWVGRSTALLFTAARQLPDWIHGADAATAFTLGIRFRQATPAEERVARILPVVEVSDSAGVRVLRVHAAGARTIEVMGDFTEWDAQPLSRRGVAFERAIAMSSGSHRMVVRIDGGAWRTALNTPAVDDELGGRVGLLVVP